MTDRLETAIRELAAALLAELEAETAGQEPDRLLSVSDAADALGIGRTLAYAEMQRGRLRSVKVGRRRLVPSSALGAYSAREDQA